MASDSRQIGRLLLSLLLSVLLVGPTSVGVSGVNAVSVSEETEAIPAATMTDREAVAYVRMLDELRAYLMLSMHYVGSDREAALYHAGHPIQCYWPFMEPIVRSEDPELAERLESNFESLPSAAAGKRGSSEYRGRVRSISLPLIDDAEATVIDRNRRMDPAFQARVTSRLLDWTVYKYRKAHNERGNITLMGQYQDAYQLTHRAEKRFEAHVRPSISEEEAAEIGALFDRLQLAVPITNDRRLDTTPAGEVERLARAIDENVSAAVESDTPNRDPNVVAEQARDDLDAASRAYADGQSNAARRIVAQTYLANAQWLLGGAFGYPDRPDTPQRVTYFERNFTYRLPGLIERDAPTAAVRRNITVVQSHLEYAGAVRERAAGLRDAPDPDAVRSTDRDSLEHVAAPGVGVSIAVFALLLLVLIGYRRHGDE